MQRLSKKVRKKTRPNETRSSASVAQRKVLAAFKSQLREANLLFAENKRDGVTRSIVATLAFVRGTMKPKGRELTRALYALLQSLADLENGRAAPLLKPSKVANRPQASTVMKLSQAFAVVTADFLIERGHLSVEEACRLVVRELQRVDLNVGNSRTGMAWKVVKGWRDRLSKLPFDDQQKHTAEAAKREIVLKPSVRPAEARSILVKNLRVALHNIDASALE